MTRNTVGTWSTYRPFDIGIAALPLDLPWIVKEPFARTKMLMLVPKGHPLASMPRVSVGDTEKYPLVALQTSSFARQEMDKEFRRLGITPDIVCETQNVMSACQLVASGIGITPVDPLLLTAIGLTGVKAVEWDISIYLEYCFFRPISGTSSPLIQKFSAALQTVVTDICDGSTGRFIKRLPMVSA